MSSNAIAVLLERGGDEGYVELSEIDRLGQELELDDEELEAVYRQLDEQGSKCGTTVVTSACPIRPM